MRINRIAMISGADSFWRSKKRGENVSRQPENAEASVRADDLVANE